MSDDALSRLRAAALHDLEAHWGSVYLISVDCAGTWFALARELPAGPALTAATAGELRVLIRADYDRRTLPQPRPGDQGSL